MQCYNYYPSTCIIVIFWNHESGLILLLLMENCSMASHYSQNNCKQLTNNYKNWHDLALSILISSHTTCIFTYYISRTPFSTLIYEIQSCHGNVAHFLSACNNIPTLGSFHHPHVQKRKMQLRGVGGGRGRSWLLFLMRNPVLFPRPPHPRSEGRSSCAGWSRCPQPVQGLGLLRYLPSASWTNFS